MRAISKIIGFVRYGHDDSLILAALPFIIAFNIFCQVLTSKGLGLDIWFVEEDDIRTFLILIFASELSYATALALVKLSILAFFLRIFPDQKFRTVVRWTMIFILVMCPLYLALILAQRRPLDVDNPWCMERCFGYLDDDSSDDATAENWDQAEEKDWGNCYVWGGPIPHDRQFRSHPKPDSIFNVTEHNRYKTISSLC
ncbi:hypothetical protein Forpe1208_v011537 [Fusarium oxysporum f. sp. rapae]|uniref:Rhodopsin domain-containing protein n=1 Tax=Fusarium oxysporum f. sp. rapae TaxID=485398 RepID=A0A8J5TQG5_FUSOX|nr:hypothetical protein Forpe1208_v011537 [Fusarium oxysporum f. sp. rapae]